MRLYLSLSNKELTRGTLSQTRCLSHTMLASQSAL